MSDGQSVAHLRYTAVIMKSSTIPAIRVEPELREQLEGVLAEGESLSTFVEASVRESIQRRLQQSEFVTRGLASIAAAKQSNRLVSSDSILRKLETRLDRARAAKAKRTPAR